jgi:anti-anti-sigma factor
MIIYNEPPGQYESYRLDVVRFSKESSVTNMAIWHEQKSNCFIIHVDESELTEDLIDRMRQVITVSFLNRHYNLIFDLSMCTMIDSYFIGLLISTYREVKELGGNLYCAGVDGQVAHAFEVIRLDRVVEVFDTVDEAVQKIRSESPSTEDDFDQDILDNL